MVLQYRSLLGRERWLVFVLRIACVRGLVKRTASWGILVDGVGRTYLLRGELR